MVLGFEGLSYHDEDFYPLQIYSTIMGAGGSSRLFQEIREKRGLVYSIFSSVESFSDSGTFQVLAGTGENEIKELLPVLCNELVNSSQKILQTKKLKKANHN